MEDEEIVEEITEEISDEADELLELVRTGQNTSAERHAEILGRIEVCQNRVETLSSTATAESPLLAQVIATMAEIRGELASVKSSVDSLLSRPTPSASLPVTEIVEEPITDPANVEDPPEAVENLPTPPPKKNRFI